VELSTVAMRAAKVIWEEVCKDYDFSNGMYEEDMGGELGGEEKLINQIGDIIEKHMKEASLQQATPMDHIMGFPVKTSPFIPKGVVFINDESFKPPVAPEDLKEMMKKFTDEFTVDLKEE